MQILYFKVIFKELKEQLLPGKKVLIFVLFCFVGLSGVQTCRHGWLPERLKIKLQTIREFYVPK